MSGMCVPPDDVDYVWCPYYDPATCACVGECTDSAHCGDFHDALTISANRFPTAAASARTTPIVRDAASACWTRMGGATVTASTRLTTTPARTLTTPRARVKVTAGQAPIVTATAPFVRAARVWIPTTRVQGRARSARQATATTSTMPRTAVPGMTRRARAWAIASATEIVMATARYAILERTRVLTTTHSVRRAAAAPVGIATCTLGAGTVPARSTTPRARARETARRTATAPARAPCAMPDIALTATMRAQTRARLALVEFATSRLKRTRAPAAPGTRRPVHVMTASALTTRTARPAP
eukprot:CAMPEP_0203824118 /NCGR_PEP_ID=MMETSP0115-20131106/51013_1 /ASSEMBLY_ACC=CAM_ASM_000227 /TAXON_ID=33651 /ORGANISM="Bicosoecid sp, Strain ms1" /LENGTH=299 /DNA_ID=CAMNT_0050733157 /DNA_START=1 /DNA_END=898 /DNA_ORIENTATION=+